MYRLGINNSQPVHFLEFLKNAPPAPPHCIVREVKTQHLQRGHVPEPGQGLHGTGSRFQCRPAAFQENGVNKGGWFSVPKRPRRVPMPPGSAAAATAHSAIRMPRTAGCGLRRRSLSQPHRAEQLPRRSTDLAQGVREQEIRNHVPNVTGQPQGHWGKSGGHDARGGGTRWTTMAHNSFVLGGTIILPNANNKSPIVHFAWALRSRARRWAFSAEVGPVNEGT